MAATVNTDWSARVLGHAGRRRYYLDSEAGEYPLLFLHGIPSYHILWREVLTWLDRDIRAIAPDLTGFGLSDLPADADLSPDAQARDMLVFLDELEIERFGIVAHDYGALVASALVERAAGRVTHLALMNTSLRRRDWSGSRTNPLRLIRLPVVGELALKLARPFMLKRAYGRYVAERHKLDGDLMDALWEPFENGFARTLLRLFRQDWGSDADFERWRATLRRFERPVLITWGGLDPTFSVPRGIDIVTLLPHAVFMELRHSNHFLPIDAPQTLARLINELVIGGAGGDAWQPTS